MTTIRNWFLRDGLLYGDVYDGSRYVYTWGKINRYDPETQIATTTLGTVHLPDATLDRYFAKRLGEFRGTLSRL